MKKRKVIFPSSEGKLSGLLTYPDSGGKCPLMIMVGGWRYSSWKNPRNEAVAQALGELGIGTLAFSFSGHPSFAPESEGDIRRFSPRRGMEQVASALDFLQTRRRVDMDRLAISGASVGGSVALLALSRLRAFRCGVLISTRSDYHQSKPGNYSFTQGNRRFVNRSMMRSGRAYNFYEEARRIEAPVLLIHGDQDEHVPFQQSVTLQSYLQDGTLVRVTGANHTLRGYLNLIALNVSAFVQSHKLV